MLQSVKAEIDESGTVHLLEPLRVTKRTQAIVTLLEETNGGPNQPQGNVKQVLEFLKNNRLPEEARPTAEETEAQIEENRNSWD